MLPKLKKLVDISRDSLWLYASLKEMRPARPG